MSRATTSTTPAYAITADGADVTGRIAGNLISLRLTDKPGMEADELEIVVTDAEGRITLPRRGAKLRAAIGWRGDLVDKGMFEVDEVTHAGPPDVVTIRARSAEFRGPLKQQREEAYDAQTIGDILGTVAARNGLTPAIEEGLADVVIDHIDQTNESDLNFLTRLGQDYDAVATVKAGRLLFIPAGHPLTVGGRPLPTTTVRRSEADTHEFTIADRGGTYTGVRAQWRDLDQAVTEYATAGAGSDGNLKTLKRTFPTAAEAQKAADAELKRLRRGAHELRLTLASGNARLIANAPLRLIGWRPEIDGLAWVIQEVTHSIDGGGGGYVTDLTAQAVD